MRKAGLLTVWILLAVIGGIAAERYVFSRSAEKPKVVMVGPTEPGTSEPGYRFSEDERGVVFVSPETTRRLGVELAHVTLPHESDSLTMMGSLFIDSSRLAYIHSRFAGEIVELGTVEQHPDESADKPAIVDISDPHPQRADAGRRPLRVGDHVKQGQLLAVVWSQDIGEKKSDLVEALCRRSSSKNTLERLEGLVAGTVTQQVLRDAQRQYEMDLIAVERAERTLRSWKVPEEEITESRKEAERIRSGQTKQTEGDARFERTWANVEIRAPFDGVILEKNISIGEIVETTKDMFNIADLSRLGVIVNAYEEDVPRLLKLKPEQRKWTVRFKSEPELEAITGQFDVVGSVIDPAQHTAAVMGWVDNPNGKFRVGQFVTARVALPLSADVVSVPNSAIIDVGDHVSVLVADGPQANRIELRNVELFRRGRNFALIYRQPSPQKETSVGAKSLVPDELVVSEGNLELFGLLQEQPAPPRPAATPHKPPSTETPLHTRLTAKKRAETTRSAKELNSHAC